MDDWNMKSLTERMDQLERDNNERFNDLLKEVQRRDEWIINSIWQLIGSSNLLIVAAATWYFIIHNQAGFLLSLGYFAIGVVVFFSLNHWLGRLEEDDKIKIDRGSVLSSWLWGE